MIRSHTSCHAHDVAEFVVQDMDDVIVVKLKEQESMWSPLTLFLDRPGLVRLGDAIVAYLDASDETEAAS